MNAPARTPLPALAKADFERAVAALGPSLRKLLGELRITSPADLVDLDLLALLKRQGVGRGDLRKLQQLMRAHGARPALRAARPVRRGALLVRIPPALADAIGQAADLARLEPEEWVLRTLAARVGDPNERRLRRRCANRSRGERGGRRYPLSQGSQRSSGAARLCTPRTL